jgi:hypothetical protein
MSRVYWVIGLGALLVAGQATAGTTTIDFTQGLGNLVQLGGSGTLTIDSNCDAVFTGTPTYLIGNGSTPVTTSGTVSITMNIVPASDVGPSDEPGLVLIDNNDGTVVTATVEDGGLVTLTNGIDTDTMQFGAPAAAGTAMTLTYNPVTDVATLTQSGSFSDTAVINGAFPFQLDTPAIRLGVVSFGGGKFESLSATGTGVPTLDSTGVCGGEEGEGEGLGEEGEGEAEGEPVEPVVTITGGSFYVVAGSSFTLGLDGADGALGFEWRKDGVAISGADDDTLVRSPATESDAGNYQCAVDFGAKQVVLSNVVPVVVLAPGGLPALGAPGLLVLGTLMAGAMLARGRKK